MATRSLQASAKGIEQANLTLSRYGLNQNNLARDLGLSRQTVNKFFRGQPVDRENFALLCDRLNLEMQDVAVLQGISFATSESKVQSSDESIASLVRIVRNHVYDDIQMRCGSMRVLDMTQPIGLDAIYTTVNIFEKVTGRQRQAIADLLQGWNFEELTSLGQVKEKRVPGLVAVEKHPKLMILGKPGAGKTTFLKWIAIQCNNGQSRADQVPAFVTLKAFAEAKGQPDLLTYLGGQWADCGVKDAQATVTLLSKGRVLLLLDGLDEVRDLDHDRVLQEIRDFSTRFRNCQFVMTCRIAAREYTFEQFTEVEVADFDDEQIADFVGKWFIAKQDPMKIDRFLEKLRGNVRIRELATNPLLLTLLCLVFQETADFPTNRSELYREGLDVLLKKWDAKRNIERDALHQRSVIYQSLSLQRKEALLSQIAFTTFERGDIFFKQQAVENYIAEFIRNLPNVSDEPESLELDSEAILKSIEAQHGLLVERARGIYSFSHLTFQEYFTARKIAFSPITQSLAAWGDLVSHITETRWQEIFLLTVGILQSADDLVLLMKAQIDQLVAGDEKLQQFLFWLSKKASSVGPSYKPAAVRAYYFALDQVRDYDLALSLDHNVAFVFAPAYDDSLGVDGYGDLTLDYAFVQACNLTCHLDPDDTLIPAVNKLYSDVLALDTADAFELKQALKRLKDELNSPVPLATATDQQVNGKAWTEQLKDITLQHRNIGHNWQFSSAQAALLEQYYRANKLLVACLNSDCYVTRSVREEIEATLLLPQSLLQTP